MVEAEGRGRQWEDVSGGSLTGKTLFAPVETSNIVSNSAGTSTTVSPTPRLQSLPPAATLTSSLRPPTLRTRSTGGLLLTTSDAIGNEFDKVEHPSPILTSPHQGLAGLSESLAHLMKERRHSFVQGDENDQYPGESRQRGSGLSKAGGDQETSGIDIMQSKGKRFKIHNTASGHLSNPSSRPVSPMTRSDRDVQSITSSAKSSMAFQSPFASPFAAPSKAGSSLTSNAAIATGNHSQVPPGQSATLMLRRASADKNMTSGPQVQSLLGPSAAALFRRGSADKQVSGTSSYAGSPPESGSSTPRLFHNGKVKPQVLETNHLQLQTHGPSGRRMINQYIIETELGRGVHGKVRLARDTETGERVAVKIVEREGKKRLGGAMGWHPNKAGQEDSEVKKDAGLDGKAGGLNSVDIANPSTSSVPAMENVSQHAHFAGLPTTSPPRSPGLSPSRSGIPPSPGSLAASARYGRWGSGAPSRPTYGDKEAEKAREREKEKVRKRLLWTTDKKVKREIALLKKCAHENVVQLKEVIDDPSSKKIFMVLEYMEGGEVQWKDGRGFPTLTVDEARRTLRDVVLGLEYLHYQGIIHRDIKPANLLWDTNRRVKISDFGVSHFSYALLVASGGLPSLDSDEERMKDPSLVDDHELAKTAGSPAFFAPELCMTGEPAQTMKHSSPNPTSNRVEDAADFPWKQAPPSQTSEATPSLSSANTQPSSSLGRKSRPPITKAIDVWALGVTLYCLLFGHVPFTADSEFALFAVIPREDYEIPKYMGANRIQIGPRRKRWTSLPQWRDEEADVDRESEGDEESDVDPSNLCEEAKLVRDLLDRLLEKDPSKRIKLEEVKKHPWVVRDIADPPLWLSETDPAQLPFVQVSNEEVEGALTGFSRIKQTLKKFQTKLFAGLGVQNHQVLEQRPDQQHRRVHILGGAVKRQRSKSASHAHGPPSLILTSSEDKMNSSEKKSTGTSAPSTSVNTPKGSQAHRPHQFFSRRPSTALLTPDKVTNVGGPASKLRRGDREKSQSQPNSRPHSPQVVSDRALATEHLGVAPAINSGESHLEKGQATAHRRPSSFFRRTGSRIEARDSQNTTSSEGNTRPQDLPLPSSRPSSKAGTMRMNSVGAVTMMAKSDSSTAPRSSQDSEAGHWSFVSASQSGNNTLPGSTSNRTRSRSRLGEVFRNVLGHHTGMDRQHSLLKSRPGTASSSQTADRNTDRSVNLNSTSTIIAPLTAYASEKVEDRDDQQSEPGIVDQVAGIGQKEGIRKDGKDSQESGEQNHHSETADSGGLAPTTVRSVEVDDYDVDLDLSDDDFEEGKGNEGGQQRSHSILRNAGNGWVMERGDSSGASSNHRPDSVNLDSLTPSVEGGYNLFKAPYSGTVVEGIGGGEDEGTYDDLESYAMTQVHSDEAEALRRASAKVGDARHGSFAPHYHHETKSQVLEGGHATMMGDVTASSDDRFADADEEEEEEREGEEEEEWGNTEKAKKEGTMRHEVQSRIVEDEGIRGNDNDDYDDEDEDDDDGGVSFKARKRAPS